MRKKVSLAGVFWLAYTFAVAVGLTAFVMWLRG